MKNSNVYSVVLLPEAEKFYRGLSFSDRAHFERVTKAIESLKMDPYQGKPLKHQFKGRYALRVGMYRIIYLIEKHKIMVYVLDIGHRRDVYR